MATTTGSEYDHITISDGTDQTIHYLKDTVARGDISDLKSAVEDLHAFDYLSYYTPATKTINGVTFTVNPDKSITAVGTATGTAFINYIASTASLPDFITAGSTYYLMYNSTNVLFEIYPYVNGTQGTVLVSTLTNREITIPSDATGILIRLSVKKNFTANETVRPYFTKIEAPERLVKSLERNNGVSTRYRPESCDDVTTNSIIFVSSGGGVKTVPDYPLPSGWLKTTCVGNGEGSQIKLQIAYPYTTSQGAKIRRCDAQGVWGEWYDFGKIQGDVTYNVTQNINRDEYNNTYTITASPQITTDSHGWLAPVDTESTSQSNATDMTPAIMTMLNSTGYCHLGEGLFYVSGGINMPAYSTIEGCGSKTVIRFLDSVQSGYVIQPQRRCAIKNILFKGGNDGPSDLQSYNAPLGSRHGIYMVANADGSTSYSFGTGVCNIIDGCSFEYFDGSAIYAANTGGGLRGVVTASNVNIYKCKVGINIDYYSEYNKFTNVIVYSCNIACINNGGNNLFVGCTFHGVIGYVLDNTNGDKSNNAHGTCSACTFNHIDNVNQSSSLGGGNAIEMRGADNGFIFDGCQFWYGEILLENSRGIQISNSLFGGGTPTIVVRGTYPAFFNSCIFHSTPSLDVNTGTVFNNCYLSTDGSAVTP